LVLWKKPGKEQFVLKATLQQLSLNNNQDKLVTQSSYLRTSLIIFRSLTCSSLAPPHPVPRQTSLQVQLSKAVARDNCDSHTKRCKNNLNQSKKPDKTRQHIIMHLAPSSHCSYLVMTVVLRGHGKEDRALLRLKTFSPMLRT